MRGPRTLEEIKEDILSRIGHRAPFILADKNESEEALASLNGVEPEPWAAAWSRLGARWEEKARAEEKSGDPQKIKQAYLKAYTYYGIGRHPFPSSPGKMEAYRKTREMYLAAARFFDPPLERVAIPFEGKAVVGYLRLPAKRPAPLPKSTACCSNAAPCSSARLSMAPAGSRRMWNGHCDSSSDPAW